MSITRTKKEIVKEVDRLLGIKGYLRERLWYTDFRIKKLMRQLSEISNKGQEALNNEHISKEP